MFLHFKALFFGSRNWLFNSGFWTLDLLGKRQQFFNHSNLAPLYHHINITSRDHRRYYQSNVIIIVIIIVIDARRANSQIHAQPKINFVTGHRSDDPKRLGRLEMIDIRLELRQ